MAAPEYECKLPSPWGWNGLDAEQPIDRSADPRFLSNLAKCCLRGLFAPIQGSPRNRPLTREAVARGLSHKENGVVVYHYRADTDIGLLRLML